MTPKDKAIELVNKYHNISLLADYGGMDFEIAKQCAIICASELMTSYNKWIEFEYWHDVKTEILKLS